MEQANVVDKCGLGILNLPFKFQVVKCRSCVIIQFSINQDTFMHTGVLLLDKVGHACPIIIIQFGTKQEASKFDITKQSRSCSPNCIHTI